MSSTKTFTPIQDGDMIRLLLQGGAERRRGEEELFNCFAYFIKEGIHKFALTQEDAFDAYSDTVLAAIEKIVSGAFEGRSALKTWLYQIYHNKCVDLLRKNSTNKNKVHKTYEATELVSQLSDTSKSVVQQLVDRTDWDILKRKLVEIGQSCKELLMYWADGYSDREIVGMMTYKTADVVKTTRLRCLDKLRQLYKTNP